MAEYDLCTLCGKKGREVGKLILGVRGAVCIPCVHLCMEIIQSDPASANTSPNAEEPPEMPPPPPIL